MKAVEGGDLVSFDKLWVSVIARLAAYARRPSGGGVRLHSHNKSNQQFTLPTEGVTG